MKLFREEYYRYSDYDAYTKEYNELGLIVFEEEVAYLFNSKAKYYYDENSKIIKIERTTAPGNDDGVSELKFLDVYEYFGEDYRIITHNTHVRYLNEIEWIERNDIISIKEFKFKNKLLQSEKYSNLLQNKSYHYQYSYKAGLLETEEKKEENGTLCKRNFKDGLIILEEGRDTDGSTNKNIYSYSNGTLLLKEVYRNEQLISKIEFEYEEGRLRLENIYNKHKSIEYLAYIKKYSYSPKNEVEKIELFGRYNSKMYLFNVEETYKENNTVTEIRHEISYHEMFTGYYDFNSMLEELDDDWKQGVKEDMYEKSDFDNNLKSVKEFDAKKNLIKYEASNPDNPGEFYEKSFYHYEYGRKSQLEFVICFGIDSNGSLEEKYITKYYYK